MILPGGESNPALARSVIMTGACTNLIYYQGLHHVNNASQSEEWAPSSALLMPSGKCVSQGQMISNHVEYFTWFDRVIQMRVSFYENQIT